MSRAEPAVVLGPTACRVSESLSLPGEAGAEGLSRSVGKPRAAEDVPMAEGDEQFVQFTQSEFKELMDGITKAATEAALKATHLAIAVALEAYADAVENASIRMPSPAARQGAEVALRAVAADARRSAAQERARGGA